MCVTINRTWRPCCRFRGGPSLDVTEVPFNEYKQTDFYQGILTDMETGWAPGCVKCQQEETRGHYSLRQKSNQSLQGSEGITYIEISLSNECNLACKMCCADYSTTWDKLIKNNEKLKKYHHPKTQPNIDIETVFKGVDLSKLKHIKYLGGEPFITPQIKDLFDFLVTNNIIENIEFTCNTNVTLFPSKWEKYLSKFKKVNIELSIDGFEKVNDYIRYGKPWSLIYDNFLKWVEYRDRSKNIEVHIFTTIQAYNLHDLKKIKKLADDHNMQMHSSLLVVPEYLSINVLPKDYLENIKDEVNQKYYKSIVDHTHMQQKFIEFTKDIDSVTKMPIQEYIPELSSIIGDKNNEA
jgi:MoaA/NifB/PqqE/SkfB family radical SAM enzyme